jgi:hypothetical protein
MNSKQQEEFNDTSMDDYFSYIEKLSRDDLIILLKWEIHNRVFLLKSLADNYDKNK